jgi:hypothetical protein
VAGAPVTIESMALLSGGAVQQNWALDVSRGGAPERWVLRDGQRGGARRQPAAHDGVRAAAAPLSARA